MAHPSDPATLAAVLDRIVRESGVRPTREAPAGVEVVRRRGADADRLFLIDHAGHGAEVPAEGFELLTGKPVTGSVTVPEGGVAVAREPLRANRVRQRHRRSATPCAPLASGRGEIPNWRRPKRWPERAREPLPSGPGW
ncbi:Beta-galactosidase C-terminal domain [Streptomyces sp. NPDC006739]|uniref:Beta-galactosidase C-terminal domain n=1 Tax=Streptomyces sp. NPDC006739 TaxID=3364763 RepID=UPI0036948833